MSLLDKYELRYEYESAQTRTAKKKTNQSFRADRAGQFREMVRYLGARFTSRNSNQSAKANNK